jgi:hypothetical protein
MVSGLEREFGLKLSGYSPLFLDLPMQDHHFGYKKNSLKKNTDRQ